MHSVNSLPRFLSAFLLNSLLVILLLSSFGFSQKDYVFDIKEVRAKNFFNQGLGYLQDKSYETAIEKFLVCLKTKNRDNLVRYYLGEAFYKAGYTDEALSQWENILRLGGQDSQLVERINSIYYLRGRSPLKKIFEDYVYLNEIPSFKSKNNTTSPFRFPIQLYIDDDNVFYFLDYEQNKIGKLNANGDYIGDYFNQTSGFLHQVGLNRPVDFISYRNGFLVADFGNDRLAFIDTQQGIYQTLGEKGIGGEKLSPAQWLGPSGLALDELGNIYVVDSGNCRISYINPQGQLLFSFGQRGKSAGELLLPVGISYSQEEKRLYVCDRGNNRVVIFDNYGQFISNLGENFLEKPRQIIHHPFDKEILVICDSRDVYLYNKKREEYKSVFYNLSSSTSFFDVPNLSPLSVSFDSAGHLYVSSANRKIYVYAPLKLKYVNLNVRFENITLRRFPEVLVTVSVYNKEGLPMMGLGEQNFTLTENSLERRIKLYKSSPKQNILRGVVLIERGGNSHSRSRILNAFLKDLMLPLTENDKLDFYTVGYDNNPLDSYHSVIKDNNDAFPLLNAIDNHPYYSQLQYGTALKKAINDQLHNNFKRGILMVVFEDYDEKDFGQENYLQLIDFAKHNFVPISAVYLGENVKQAGNFKLLKSLAKKTGGEFFTYVNKESAEGIIEGFKNFKDSRYILSYQSFENNLKSGLFRTLSVKVEYKNLTGIDNKGGFPIP